MSADGGDEPLSSLPEEPTAAPFPPEIVADPLPPPPPEVAFTDTDGFRLVVLILALVIAVVFLKRSRKETAEDEAEETPKKATKKEDTPKKAKAESKAAPAAEAKTSAATAAVSKQGPTEQESSGPSNADDCCLKCGTTSWSALTWRSTERTWLIGCGRQVCKSCHDEAVEKIREAAVDEGAILDDVAMELQLPDNVAMEKLREHAEAGLAWAQYELGQRCEMGAQGVEQNLADAAYWYGLAHAQKYALAEATLGALHMVGWDGAEKDYAEAKRLLKSASSKGDARAQRFLAQIYDGGLGVPASQSSALMWLEQAAEQGFAAAQADLGFFYEHGRGVTANWKTARKWYKLAAEQGERNAQFLLGGLLLNKRGEKALPMAMRLCRQAASQAHLDAIDTLIQMEHNLKRSCAHCRAIKENLTRCSRCKAAYYCGADCQMAHWKAGHASECCESGPDCSQILEMAQQRPPAPTMPQEPPPASGYDGY